MQDSVDVIKFRRIDHQHGDFDRPRSFSGAKVYSNTLIKKLHGRLGVPLDISFRKIHFFVTVFIGIPNHLPGSSDIMNLYKNTADNL